MRSGYILGAAIFAGLLVGVLFPAEKAEAVANYTVRSHAGTQGATSQYLTCGWHSVCKTPWTSGNGLDWDAIADDHQQWRSNNFRSDASTPDNVAVADPDSFNTSLCYRIGVVVTDNGSTNRGTVYYEHVNTPKAYYQLVGDSDGTLQTFWAGIVVDPDSELDEDCPTTGDHIHQESTWTKGGGWPTASTMHTSQYVSSVWDAYIFTKSWTQ